MKVKIFLSALVMACVSLMSVAVFPARAETLDPADECFLEFVQNDLQDGFSYEWTPLYNEALEQSGREYTFTADGRTGFALLAEIASGEKKLYEVEECYFNQASPFANCAGTPVYVTFRTYLEYRDNAFYDLASGIEVSQEIVDQKAYEGFGYGYTGNGDYFQDRTETIDYARREITEDGILRDLPNYYGTIGETSCANTAGAVLIGYYDRFFENLIPDYQVYRTLGSLLIYKSNSIQIENLKIELHTLMSTDSGNAGTTFAQFQDGMNKYVTQHGYSYRTTNLMSWGNLKIDSYKQSVQGGKPVALFLSGFSMLNKHETGEGKDTITSGYCALTHVEIGCGYKIYTYYNANNTVIAERTYLKVASGLGEYGIGYLNLNGAGNLDRAISVEIY